MQKHLWLILIISLMAVPALLMAQSSFRSNREIATPMIYGSQEIATPMIYGSQEIATPMIYSNREIATPMVVEGDIFTFNGIRLRFNPFVQIRLDQLSYENLVFNSSTATYPDSCVISYTNSRLSFSLGVYPQTGLGASANRIAINATYHQEVYVRQFLLNLEFIDASPSAIYKGPKAITSQNMADNIQLVPFTDRAIQYVVNNRNLWLVGSNYVGCENIETLQDNHICLYSYTNHLARMYNTETTMFNTMVDTLKRRPGDSNHWSFLVFSEEPVLLSLNRWYNKNKAALVITNDADGEAERKMKAVYFGSNNTASPKYMTQGFVPNNIKVTNTVFGASHPVLGSLWHTLQEYGNTIGYHTHSAGADLSSDTYNSLNGVMADYDVRTWIDHSWVTNPDALCNEGWDINSPYYVLNAVNDSNINYFWLGDNLNTNPLNSFAEPGRLPHRLYEFDNLERPLWFFGRAKMQAWENYDMSYLVDMKHNLTPENLDRLLNENGLCVVYTHFFFDESATISAFFHYTDTGACEIKDEVNDRLVMLDYYQTYRDLWIDTLEAVFDRMLATEEVKITGVSHSKREGTSTIILANNSDFPLEKLFARYKDQEIVIPLLNASEQTSLQVSGEPATEPATTNRQINAYYSTGSVNFKRFDDDFLEPLDIRIYNLKGQLVCTHATKGKAKRIMVPFANYASGIYFASLEMQDGFKKTLRFYVLK